MCTEVYFVHFLSSAISAKNIGKQIKQINESFVEYGKTEYPLAISRQVDSPVQRTRSSDYSRV